MLEKYTICWRGIQYVGEVYSMLERYTVCWRGMQYVGKLNSRHENLEPAKSLERSKKNHT